METKLRRRMTAIIGDAKVMPIVGNHHARERSSTSGEVSTARRSGFGTATPRRPGRPVAHAQR